MREFMNKNPEFVLKILETQGFNQEKLEQILEVYNHPDFDFKLGAGCPDGVFLETELEEKFSHVDFFKKYLEEKNLNYEDMRVIKQSCPEGSYRIIRGLNTSNEFRIYFYPFKK